LPSASEAQPKTQLSIEERACMSGIDRRQHVWRQRAREAMGAYGER
jgi:hypothetical protein